MVGSRRLDWRSGFFWWERRCWFLCSFREVHKAGGVRVGMGCAATLALRREVLY